MFTNRLPNPHNIKFSEAPHNIKFKTIIKINFLTPKHPPKHFIKNKLKKTLTPPFSLVHPHPPPRPHTLLRAPNVPYLLFQEQLKLILQLEIIYVKLLKLKSCKLLGCHILISSLVGFQLY